MKIKRFEAPNMSEALRMIKKEFGPDAVILSAKTQKKTGRVFGTQKAEQVVVTAAYDPAPADTAAVPKSETGGNGDHGADQFPAAASQGPAQRKTTFFEKLMPITRTGQQKLKNKFDRLSPDPRVASTYQASVSITGNGEQQLCERLENQGVRASLAAELAEKTYEVLAPGENDSREVFAALSQVIAAKNWIAPQVHAQRSGHPRIIALVGACGVGKTTVAAKLTAEAVVRQQSVGLISLDNHRIAGALELERYAQLMGVSMETLHATEHIDAVLSRLADKQLVVIDTPGIGPGDTAGKRDLQTMLAKINAQEIHLLISAICAEPIIDRMLDCFQPFEANRLLVTQSDWVPGAGHLLNLMHHCRLPLSYISDGPHVSESIYCATPDSLAALFWEEAQIKKEDERVTVIQQRKAADAEDHFVANRNSELFHRSECRSVQRISTDNIIVFQDQAEAMGRGFKPCRMCCADLMISKPIDRLVRRPAAGNRYFAR